MVDCDAPQSSRGELVTVGIPSYNRQDETRRAVRSVLAQGYEPVRVVVSDNASDDGTAEVIADLAAGDRRIVALLHDRNAGPTANFQCLRAHVEPGYFMWLGDDDWLGDGVLAACSGALDGEPDVVMAAAAIRYHGEGGDWLERPGVVVDDGDPRRRVLDYFRQVSGNGVFYGLVRSSTLERVPALSNDMGGDWFHVAALAFRGKIRTIDAVELHRSVGGATRSLADVARHLDLGWLSRSAPQVAIAGHALADIGWRSPVYAELGRAGRLTLGARSAGIILRRFLPGAVVKFGRLQWRSVTHRSTAPELVAESRR